jgi:hypothetical protein
MIKSEGAMQQGGGRAEVDGEYEGDYHEGDQDYHHKE